MWEASGFVSLEIEPNMSANLVLPQAPFFEVVGGTDCVTKRITRSSTITRLRDHLLKFYPPDHLVHFVTTGTGVGADAFHARIETISLADLDHPGDGTASTLLVPRATPFGMRAGVQMDFAFAAAPEQPSSVIS